MSTTSKPAPDFKTDPRFRIMEARRETSCTECQMPIHKGDRIRLNITDDVPEWVHERCLGIVVVRAREANGTRDIQRAIHQARVRNSVKCTHCGAATGQPCRTLGSPTEKNHTQRNKLWSHTAFEQAG